MAEMNKIGPQTYPARQNSPGRPKTLVYSYLPKQTSSTISSPGLLNILIIKPINRKTGKNPALFA